MYVYDVKSPDAAFWLWFRKCSLLAKLLCISAGADKAVDLKGLKAAVHKLFIIMKKYSYL